MKKKYHSDLVNGVYLLLDVWYECTNHVHASDGYRVRDQKIADSAPIPPSCHSWAS